MFAAVVWLDQISHAWSLKRSEVGDLNVCGIPFDLLAPFAHGTIFASLGGGPNGQVSEKDGFGKSPRGR